MRQYDPRGLPCIHSPAGKHLMLLNAVFLCSRKKRDCHVDFRQSLFYLQFRLRSAGVRLLDLNDSSLLHRNAAVLVVAELDDHRVVSHVDHNAVES